MLPEGWRTERLQNVCDIRDNLRSPINTAERNKRIEGKSQLDLYPYYGATGQVGWIDDYLTDGEYVLIGEDGAPFFDFAKAKAYLINGKTWVNNHAHILEAKPGISTNRFVLHYLNSFNYKGFVNGTTRLKLTKGSLVEIPIPLPPLAEQERIVSKIEELFSELEKGKEQILLAQQQLKTYRQAVLKWAFEGRLTNADVVDGVLPEGRETVTLADVADSCLGKMLDKQKNKGELKPYLGNINVRWNSFDLDDLSEMRFEASEQARYGIVEGDLIICEGGEPGRAAIWKGTKEMMIQKALHRVRFGKRATAQYFLHYLFLIAQSKELQKYFTGTTIKHLTGGSLKKVTFPLAPLEEQHRIVQEIESRLSVCDAMEATLQTSLAQAEVLRQCILKRAFEGRLI